MLAQFAGGERKPQPLGQALHLVFPGLEPPSGPFVGGLGFFQVLLDCLRIHRGRRRRGRLGLQVLWVHVLGHAQAAAGLFPVGLQLFGSSGVVLQLVLELFQPAADAGQFFGRLGGALRSRCVRFRFQQGQFVLYFLQLQFPGSLGGIKLPGQPLFVLAEPFQFVAGVFQFLLAVVQAFGQLFLHEAFAAPGARGAQKPQHEQQQAHAAGPGAGQQQPGQQKRPTDGKAHAEADLHPAGEHLGFQQLVQLFFQELQVLLGFLDAVVQLDAAAEGFGPAFEFFAASALLLGPRFGLLGYRHRFQFLLALEELFVFGFQPGKHFLLVVPLPLELGQLVDLFPGKPGRAGPRDRRRRLAPRFLVPLLPAQQSAPGLPHLVFQRVQQFLLLEHQQKLRPGNVGRGDLGIAAQLFPQIFAPLAQSAQAPADLAQAFEGQGRSPHLGRAQP